jgi:hypothetical protein
LGERLNDCFSLFKRSTSMARTTPHALRLEVVERHLAGESLPTIAAALQLNPYSVRRFWRLYQRQGWDALVPLRPGPPRCGPLGDAHPRIKYVLLRLKRQHRGWGVNKLRLELTRCRSLQGLPIPQRSALASYLAPCRRALASAEAGADTAPDHSATPPSYRAASVLADGF